MPELSLAIRPQAAYFCCLLNFRIAAVAAIQKWFHVTIACPLLANTAKFGNADTFGEPVQRRPKYPSLWSAEPLFLLGDRLNAILHAYQSRLMTE